MNELEYEKRFSRLEHEINSMSNNFKELIDSNKILTTTMIENQGKSKLINVLVGSLIPIVGLIGGSLINMYSESSKANQEQDRKIFIIEKDIEAINNKTNIRLIHIENKLKINE